MISNKTKIYFLYHDDLNNKDKPGVVTIEDIQKSIGVEYGIPTVMIQFMEAKEILKIQIIKE